MPYKYAISSVSDRETPQRTWLIWNRPEYEKDYRPVTKEVAEAHPDGVRQLVTRTGEQLSRWVSLPQPEAYNVTEIRKKSRHAPVKDFMGEMLATGDYVVIHYKKLPELQVGQVIGFVKQGKARVLLLGAAPTNVGELCFPREMVKISSDLLGPDPDEEWFPSDADGGL